MPFLTRMVKLFQSTLPRGSDRRNCFITLTYNDISIHAPSRERRREGAERNPPAHHFNPRSLTGATNSRNDPAETEILFQSTLPHGSDTAALADGWKKLFQSTLPHGSDSKPFIPNEPIGTISIHAPSRERL